MATHGRTTVGVSGLPAVEGGQFLARFLTEETPASFQDRLTLGAALKLAAEDLKAYYMEAAAAQPGARSSRAVADWFWRQTAAGQLLRRLQPCCAQSPDSSVRAVAERSLVPRSYAQ